MVDVGVGRLDAAIWAWVRAEPVHLPALLPPDHHQGELPSTAPGSARSAIASKGRAPTPALTPLGLAYTQPSHTTLAHTQPYHTGLAHTQLSQLEPAPLCCPSAVASERQGQLSCLPQVAW